MPTVNLKPKRRPFRRVLYREDSGDSTIITDVSPRSIGHLITEPRIEHDYRTMNNAHSVVMADSSRRLLMKEGTLYKKPSEKIKYIKRIRNDPVSRYLFLMKQYNLSTLRTLSHRQNEHS